MIFKCKNCGGNAIYHPDKKAMWCPHCESLDAEERVESPSLENCGNCGAPLEGVGEYTSALKCAHCGAYLILKDRVEGENRPDLILPFQISRQGAEEAMKKEFGRRIFTPASFLSRKSLEGMEGSYVPFWLYDYHSNIDYEGKATKVQVYVRGDTEYTETSHYRVVRKMDIDFQKIPADASKRMADDVMDLMEPYEYRALENFTEKYMSGYEGERVNFGQEELEERVEARARRNSEELLNDTISGYSTCVTLHKDISLTRNRAYFALLPVWVYRYTFRGKEYTYHVNGQTGKVIGQTPTDTGKAILYSGTVFALTSLACVLLNLLMEVL